MGTLLVGTNACSYVVRDFVILRACGDCPDDGLLMPLRFEEGSLLPMLLSCSASPPLDGIIGPKRDELSRHTRSLHLNLCSSKLESCAQDAGGRFDLEIFYLHGSFVPLCCVHTICLVEWHRLELLLRPNPHISNLNLSFFSSKLLRSFYFWRQFSTCIPHPYHFPYSRLHGFLVGRAKSRLTLFLQAALGSQIL